MSQDEPKEDVKARGAETGLPPELKAIEAELGRLAPREDRLDRERLVFLAGQASIAARSGASAGWAWPASLAAFSALAASLLTAFLMPMRPNVVENAPNVPRRQAPSDVSFPHDQATATENDKAPEAEKSTPRPPSEPGSLEGLRLARLGYPEADQFRANVPYLHLLDEVLAGPADPWAPPPPGRDRQPSPDSVFTRRSLGYLLDGSAWDNILPTRPAGADPRDSGGRS